ncbi:hypothetical protein PCASD_20426 [Puccinia coronata f. sp. avenae]|uniref:Formyl transferase N-terminal domain-containing protein n=1 Tax=Puccinia coronata f. sp. avenae TaxID=200324 RepID=A0A2N5U1U3_9BASI|nr:hypothetical protein PCASD_20426 [Puccinia coronata f. sp. avenae]
MTARPINFCDLTKASLKSFNVLSQLTWANFLLVMSIKLQMLTGLSPETHLPPPLRSRSTPTTTKKTVPTSPHLSLPRAQALLRALAMSRILSCGSEVFSSTLLIRLLLPNKFKQPDTPRLSALLSYWIPAELTSQMATHQALNIHPSLQLPRHGGSSPIQRQLANQEGYTAASILYIYSRIFSSAPDLVLQYGLVCGRLLFEALSQMELYDKIKEAVSCPTPEKRIKQRERFDPHHRPKFSAKPSNLMLDLLRRFGTLSQ